MPSDMHQLSVRIDPQAAFDEGCRVTLNGAPVIQQNAVVAFAADEWVAVALNTVGAWELDNWNDGETFDYQWAVQMTEDKSLVAYLAR